MPRPTPRQRPPNPTDAWTAPEHRRMGSGMRRYRHGIRGLDGLWVVLPGERVMPEPSCLRLQREAEARKKIILDNS